MNRAIATLLAFAFLISSASAFLPGASREVSIPVGNPSGTTITNAVVHLTIPSGNLNASCAEGTVQAAFDNGASNTTFASWSWDNFDPNGTSQFIAEIPTLPSGGGIIHIGCGLTGSGNETSVFDQFHLMWRGNQTANLADDFSGKGNNANSLPGIDTYDTLTPGLQGQASFNVSSVARKAMCLTGTTFNTTDDVITAMMKPASLAPAGDRYIWENDDDAFKELMGKQSGGYKVRIGTGVASMNVPTIGVEARYLAIMSTETGATLITSIQDGQVVDSTTSGPASATPFTLCAMGTSAFQASHLAEHDELGVMIGQPKTIGVAWGIVYTAQNLTGNVTYQNPPVPVVGYTRQYSMTDATNAGIDFAAGIVVALASQTAALGSIIVGGILMGLLAIMLDRIFGIFGGFSHKLF